jgi:hypothetical protein
LHRQRADLVGLLGGDRLQDVIVVQQEVGQLPPRARRSGRAPGLQLKKESMVPISRARYLNFCVSAM